MQLVLMVGKKRFHHGSNIGSFLEQSRFDPLDDEAIVNMVRNPGEDSDQAIVLGDRKAWCERAGDWVQTYSGGRWWPHDPHPYDVDVRDYPQLAHVNRYGGATLAPYSDAQHSCFVHDLVERWGGTTQERREALFHDWHEIYPPGDQLRPVFSEQGLDADARASLRALRMMQAKAKHAVRSAFGLSEKMPEIVKRADLVALATERKFLLKPVPWKHEQLPEQPDPRTRKLAAWDAPTAAKRFKKRLQALKG